ncbi:MAG: hypothetical protein NTZ56_15300 [Acidobacteria bacterium]|nr:hypothetical protein [Acidobacteriota bacterium]
MSHVASRLVAVFAFLVILCASVHGEGFGPSLTVILDFDDAPAAKSLGEMRREVAAIMKRTGHSVEVRLRSETAPNEEFEDLVLVKLTGSCRMNGIPYAAFIDERGPSPLAWAHTVEGEILPFSTVACDKLRRTVGSVLFGGQRAQGDQLLGRALGRVVAHELYHIVTKSTVHAKSGVFKESLSGAQLIADHLDFAAPDARRLVAHGAARSRPAFAKASDAAQ